MAFPHAFRVRFLRPRLMSYCNLFLQYFYLLYQPHCEYLNTYSVNTNILKNFGDFFRLEVLIYRLQRLHSALTTPPM